MGAAALRRRVLRQVLLAWALAAMTVAALCTAPIEPPGQRLTPAGTVVLAADGTVLQRDTRDGIRIPVTLDRIAPLMVQATLAAEDQRFFAHPGVDPLAVLRALAHPGTRSGASTLTQQLARRLYLDEGAPFLVRKPQEALLALALEARTSKDELLSAYLNEVPYGRGAYGLEAAARVYFGVAAADLDLARAAFLAGLPRYPAAGSEPGLGEALRRQRYVLERMVDDGRISRADADAAATRPLGIVPELDAPIAPHFVALARDELARVRPDLAGVPGLIIETTLDAGLQHESERLARLHLTNTRALREAQAAVVVVEPGTGRILALAGNVRANGPAGEVNLALARRQPGSALKPFLYAAALERGRTAASPLLDIPVTFRDGSETYTPINNDRRFHGPVSLRTALASSLNVPAARLLDELGMEAFLGMAQRFGLDLRGAEAHGHAVVLGGAEVRLLDLAGAYAALAAGGEFAPPFAVLRVRDRAGRVIYERPPARPVAVVSPEVAWLIGDILRDRVAREPGFGHGSPLENNVNAAAKTGTTTEFRDNWTAGFTAHHAVAVWVGHEDNRPMAGVSGVSGAAPIWRDVIEAASAGRPATNPGPPPGLVRLAVCPPTGLLPGPHCPATTSEWFLRGTEPHTQERYYDRDAQGVLRIDPPAEARAWALEAGLALRGERDADSPARPVIHQPADGARIFLAPETGSRTMVLRATAGGSSVRLVLDGRPLGTTGPEGIVLWEMTPGRHRLEAIAAAGDGSEWRTAAEFEVRER